jgi:hypothetical protein
MSLVRSEPSSSWLVWNTLQTGTWTSWAYRTTWTGEAVAIESRSLWSVLPGESVVRGAATASWNISETVSSAPAASWRIVESNPVRSARAAGWRVASLVRGAGRASWDVDRRASDVSVICIYNGINMNDGVNTWVLADASDLGSDAPVYDQIRHHDGSLVIHDVHTELVTLSVPVRAKFGDAASLAAWLEGARAACLAGGSLMWQESPSAPVRTFTIAPSPAPRVLEDNAFYLQHTAIIDLQLTRWAE